MPTRTRKNATHQPRRRRITPWRTRSPAPRGPIPALLVTSHAAQKSAVGAEPEFATDLHFASSYREGFSDETACHLSGVLQRRWTHLAKPLAATGRGQ